jgi:putative transposase
MTNHVHWVAVPGRPDSLARAFGRAHNDYSRWFNIKNHRAGHLWQNRFFSCPLDPAHLAQAMRYVELNPVRAEITASPIDYQWSSARAHCGLESPPPWLDTAQWSARYSPQQWQEVLALDFRLAGDLDRLREATRTGRPFGTHQFIAELEAKLDRRLFPGKPGRPRKDPQEPSANNDAHPAP